MHRVRVSAVSPELRRRPVPPSVDCRGHPTAAANTRHPNGRAASVADSGAKVVGRGGLLVTTQRRRRLVFRPPIAPPPPPSAPSPAAPIAVSVASPAAAAAAATTGGHATGGRRRTVATAAATDVKNDATAATKGGQGATDPEADERVHGVGQGGAKKVSGRKSGFAQRRSQQNAR